MATTLFSSVFRRPPPPPTPKPFPYHLNNNPYPCKRTWPPDFSKLSPKHQFRLERRYRRRTKLKWARPAWNKAVKLAQWGSIIGICVYGVLFLDVNDGKEYVGGPGDRNGAKGRTVFDGVREWYRRQVDELRDLRDSSRTRRLASGDGKRPED